MSSFGDSVNIKTMSIRDLDIIFVPLISAIKSLCLCFLVKALY